MAIFYYPLQGDDESNAVRIMAQELGGEVTSKGIKFKAANQADANAKSMAAHSRSRQRLVAEFLAIDESQY